MFQKWEQHYQLLLLWLQSMIYCKMLTQVIACKTSSQLNDKIHAHYLAHTSAKAQQFQTKLHETTLGNESM